MAAESQSWNVFLTDGKAWGKSLFKVAVCWIYFVDAQICKQEEGFRHVLYHVKRQIMESQDSVFTSGKIWAVWNL